MKFQLSVCLGTVREVHFHNSGQSVLRGSSRPARPELRVCDHATRTGACTAAARPRARNDVLLYSRAVMDTNNHNGQRGGRRDARTMAQQFEFQASSLLSDPSAASAAFEEHGLLVLRGLFVRTGRLTDCLTQTCIDVLQ